MIKLPKQIQKRLATEFRLAATKMGESTTLREKVYYFSVFYGEAGRQLNMHWDTDLALLHVVVQNACNQFNARGQIQQPMPTGGFAEGFAEALDEVGNQLAGTFGEDEIDPTRFYGVVARIAELTYATSGNGNYLREKGLIKF